MKPGYKRFVVEITVRHSRGYYEVEALSEAHARRVPIDTIRQGKVISFSEDAVVSNLMEIKDAGGAR